ncbi:MAG: competence/damage-inducible protein A [Lachnospiraceae bacterium]|nr:competence/damage-inducible protein A [Lachnospiraceae bacterium]
MTAEIICVGTEILMGNIVNTNAAFIAERCAGLGISNFFQTVVGDNEDRLAAVLKTAMERADVVILSGGLGPTEDDLTKEVASRLCNRELIEDAEWRKRIEEFFALRKSVPTENNWKQALVPQGCIVLDNKNGTAPGIIIEEQNTSVILLPGPPNELLPLFDELVVPYLSAKNPNVIVSKTVKICGVGESRVETMLLDLIDNQTNPTIATYAKTGEVHVRVTASAESEKEARKLIKPVVKELKSRFGDDIYSTDDETTLEKSIAELLKANSLSVTFAESCTGGMLSARFVNTPGVSEVYKQGIVTYSNKAKRKYLGVKKGTLKKYGAVSEQTAFEMAKGAAREFEADVAVAVTGIAGPDGGSEEKPVGLVYIACNVLGKIEVKEYRFKGDRGRVRDSAVSAALTLMRRCILEHYSEVAFGDNVK